MGFNPFKKHDWDKLFKKPSHKIESEIKDFFEKEIPKFFEDELPGLVRQGVEKELPRFFEKELPRLGGKFLDLIEDELEKLWRKGVIDKIIDVAQHAVPGRKVPLRLSFVELQVDPHSKIDELQRIAHKLPRGRKQIIDTIKRLTDDDVVIIHIDAKFITSTLGFDVGIPIPLDKLVSAGDKIFKRFGL